MKFITFILLLLMHVSIHAEYKNWKDENKELFWLSNAALVMDWSTTLSIPKMPGYKETATLTRDIIGENPSRGNINSFFVARLAMNYLIADNLNEQYKKLFFGFNIIMHGSAAAHNYNIGLNFSY